jgi:hypothetical protein
LALRIAGGDRFVQLPTKFDVNEWEIMEDFSRRVESDTVRAELMHVLHGAGAFRHFKDAIRPHRIEPDWLNFRQEALLQIARDWCEENNIAWK